MLARLRKLVTRHSFLVTLAAASPAVAQPGPPRSATLLAPRPVEAGDPQPIARGAVDDLPPFGSTPVTRPPAPQPNRLTGPAWLNDGYVQPTAGLIPARQPSRVQPPATDYTPPPPPPRDQPSAVSRGVDKIKTFVGGERPEPGALPVGREQPTPNTPFRGTGPNGAPVYAGPPAWRWYGYGTVTPGTNPLAPTGQYPKASANWYSVTSATPGAVPVPVMNPYRPVPGSEPPGYLAEPVARTTRPYNPTAYPQQFTQPQPQPVSQPSGFPTGAPPGVSKFGPEPIERSKFEPPADAPKLLPPPSMPLPPARVPPLPTPPPAVGVPTLTPPAASQPTLAPDVTTVPATVPLPVKPSEPMVPLPPIPVAPPVVQVETPPAAGPTALADAAVTGTSLTTTRPAEPPAPAPAAVAAPAGGDVNWRSTPHKVVPLETWGPATGTPVPPAVHPQPATDRGWQPGASVRPAAQPVARGTAPDPSRPNPVADLLGEMCRGRAKDLDVRWTGSQRLTVCFEVRTEQDAGRLVKEVCARPELRPYAIDFCVLVK